MVTGGGGGYYIVLPECFVVIFWEGECRMRGRFLYGKFIGLFWCGVDGKGGVYMF